jgi:hypothetical protein
MQTPADTISQSTRIIPWGLAAICAGLGFYAIHLQSELSGLRAQLDAARAERDGTRKGVEVAQSRPQEDLQRLTTNHDRLDSGAGADATTDPRSKTLAEPADAQPAGTFAQAFATPEMRQIVRREALTDARKGFSDLLKKWNLSGAEADQFLEFVADRDSADASDALAMLATGKLDEKSIAEQDAKQEKAKQENNARLKALLGDERYAEFAEADAREAEIKAVSKYRDHLESAGTPLTNDQRSALAKIVTAEKPDENDWQPEDVEFFTKGMTDAQLMKLRQRLESAQARISQQAAGFLSPDQIAALQAAFRSEVEEQDLTLKMARTFIQNAAPAAVAK